MQVIVSNEGHVERLEMIRNDDKKDKTVTEVGIVPIEVSETGQAETETVTVVQTEEGEGLDNLISVAEAFERSQQPDFNDIVSPVVDGTDTEKHLVRNCCICNKSLLGWECFLLQWNKLETFNRHRSIIDWYQLSSHPSEETCRK